MAKKWYDGIVIMAMWIFIALIVLGAGALIIIGLHQTVAYTISHVLKGG